MTSDDFPNISSAPPRENRVPTAENRKRVFAQMFQLSGSNVIIQFSRFAKNLFLAGFFGPATFGVWNALQVFITYGMNSHLGVLQAISRDIPMKLGSGDSETIPKLAHAGLTISVFSSILGGLIVSVLAVLTVTEGPGEMLTAFLLLPILVAQMLFLYGQSLLRAEDVFGRLSWALSFAAIIEFAVTLALVFLIGFNGILIGLAFSQGLGAVVSLWRKRSYTLKMEFDGVIIRQLIRTGFPIMLTVLGYFVLTTIDRLVIITVVGSEPLGYYSLGSMAIAGIGYIPIAINQVMLPKFAQRFGATGDPATLSGYLRVPTLATGYAMGLVLGAAILSLPIVTILLPEYIPGIPAAIILLAGFYFVAVTGSSANLLLTLNRQGTYLVFLTGTIVLAVTLDYVVLTAGWGIEAVAAVTGSSNFLFAIAFTRFTTKQYLPPQSRPFGPIFIKLFLPWALASCLVWFATEITVGGQLLTIICRLALFAGVYIPLSLFVLRRENIL